MFEFQAPVVLHAFHVHFVVFLNELLTSYKLGAGSRIKLFVGGDYKSLENNCTNAFEIE